MILLDTHIWIRWLSAAQPLPPALVDLIENAEQVTVSAISCWEVAYLAKRHRLDLKRDARSWISAALARSELGCIPVCSEIAATAAELPDHHRDPADRIIIATALVNDCQLVSFDDSFRHYGELAGRLIAT